MSWLLDTLVWTGALIALVLVVRRPVARHLGARAAYALWAIPLLRLGLPPIVLPASMEPNQQAVELMLATPAIESGGSGAPIVIEAIATGPDWGAMLVAAWLLGAAAYIILRLLAYGRLRNELLSDAQSVGTVGKVRLVETPATRSPLAFGVADKVIALPPGFMAQTDRVGRDLALAHELSHHQANDLVANFAALPLFALHWFNPLSWLGWTAMRCDQEAACDARVVEGRAASERASYAALIADAVAAPKFALAAPMACPVLGDKSIIHRLRILTMSDHSIRRRRAGNVLVAIAALALPLTASFSYAQSHDGELPAPPAAPGAPLPPEASLPPQAPVAPDAAEAPTPVRELVDAMAPDGLREVHVLGDGHVERIERLHTGRDKVRVRKFAVRDSDGELIHPESPEFREQMRALEERLGKLDGEIRRAVVIDETRIDRATAHAHAAAERAAHAGAHAARMAPRVVEDCDASDGLSESRNADGTRTVRICRTRIAGHAIRGLRAARAEIAHNHEMGDEARRQVLESLDREIAHLEDED